MTHLLPAHLARLSRRTIAVGIAALVLMVGAGAGAVALLSDGSTDDAATTESTADSPAESGMGAGDDNVAVAKNTRDGGEVYAVRLKIVQTDADVVDSANAAVAAASCEDCTTVAIAIEGVLVIGTDVDTVTPVNLAIALNSDCSGCQTLAAAYQYVTQNDTRVRITGDGRRTVASLRQELNTLRVRDLTLEEVAAEVDRIAGAFYEVLMNEVVPIGQLTGEPPTPKAEPPGSATASGETASPEDTQTASPTESASNSTTPSETPTKTTEDNPTATPTEPTATSTPTETSTTQPSP